MRTRRTVGTLLTCAALCAAPVVSLPAQASPQPVEPEVTRVGLPDDEPAVTRIDVPEGVSVMGVTWESDGQDSPVVEVRSLTDGRWGEWVDVSPNDDGPDPGTAEALRAAELGGPQATDPIDVLGATQVEVRTQDVATVQALEAALIDPGASDADTALDAGAPASSADATVARPTIVSRAGWGADEKLRSCTPSVAAKLNGVIVHHTADRNTYTAAEAPGMVRSIYAYHTQVQKWCDVGYNALVDRFGRIYEGRFGGLDRNVIGAHAGGFNTGTWGVSVIGNFETAALPAAAQASVEKLVAWRLGVAGLSAAKTMTVTSAGSNKYAAGATVTLPVVAAHRDVGLTACPGANYYKKMGAIRTNVSQLVAAAGGPQGSSRRLSDVTSDAKPDVLARNGAGDLMLYPGNGSAGWGTVSRIGSGWSGMNALVAAGDVTGDGHGDVYARDTSGQLWLYPTNGARGWKPRVQVGTGWNVMTGIYAVTDFNGDGRHDIAARDGEGRLWLYPTNANGTFQLRRQIGNGWQGMTAVLGTGDFDGDGRSDLMARDSAGRLWLYPGNGTGGFLTTRQVGNGWAGMTALLSVGDFDGKGAPDVLARDSAGRLWLYPGSGKGGWLTARQVGSGWSGFTALL